MAKKVQIYVNAKIAVRNGEKKPFCDCKATLPGMRYPITVKFTRNSGVNIGDKEGVYKIIIENDTSFMQISTNVSSSNGKEYKTAWVSKVLSCEKMENGSTDTPIFEDKDLEDLPF